MSPSMGHTDTLTEIALEGRNGGYLLRFDPSRGEVSLHTAEHADGPGQRLALLTGATDEVRALAVSRIPAGLTLPSADATSDDALFATGDANSDLFAAADGITAQIIMKESKIVTVDIDGVPTETPSQVDASGQFVGTNVPVEVVRSLATLFGLLSSNLFGA